MCPGMAPTAPLSWRAALQEGPLWAPLDAVLRQGLSLCCPGLQIQYYDLGWFWLKVEIVV
jgi:hypothetical protein